MEQKTELSQGARLLKRGDTFDPECHRTTHRLARALTILRAMGIEPKHAEHDPETCLLHPDNRSKRMMQFRGEPAPCTCGAQRKAPTWPAHVDAETFNLAYRLADHEQTIRGQWHQAEINREQAERRAAAAS
jgi:hypothetical protein